MTQYIKLSGKIRHTDKNIFAFSINLLHSLNFSETSPDSIQLLASAVHFNQIHLLYAQCSLVWQIKRGWIGHEVLDREIGNADVSFKSVTDRRTLVPERESTRAEEETNRDCGIIQWPLPLTEELFLR